MEIEFSRNRINIIGFFSPAVISNACNFLLIITFNILISYLVNLQLVQMAKHGLNDHYFVLRNYLFC